MIRNEMRCGSFTSSEIVALTKEGKLKGTWGVPALTYIYETNLERRLGRSVDTETNAKELLWGELLERRVFDLLGMEYILTSKETKQHQTIKYWCGSKDGWKQDGTVIDMKCPFTLKSFCGLVNPLYDGLKGIEAMNAVREGYTDKMGMKHPAHKDGDKYYYQLVSNSEIDELPFGELIVYAPYRSELPEIRQLALNSDSPEKYYWLMYADENELPLLPDNGFYKNLNIIRFEVPQADKDYLRGRVEAAGQLLYQPAPLFLLTSPGEDCMIVSKG